MRYQLRGEPDKVGLCHCTDCRSETGSAFLYYGDWTRDRFKVSGSYGTYEGRSFCTTCGSALFHLGDDGVEIALGSLDDAPVAWVPTREGWIRRREPWLMPVLEAGQHRQDPPRNA